MLHTLPVCKAEAQASKPRATVIDQNTLSILNSPGSSQFFDTSDHTQLAEGEGRLDGSGF